MAGEEAVTILDDCRAVISRLQATGRTAVELWMHPNDIRKFCAALCPKDPSTAVYTVHVGKLHFEGCRVVEVSYCIEGWPLAVDRKAADEYLRARSPQAPRSVSEKLKDNFGRRLEIEDVSGGEVLVRGIPALFEDGPASELIFTEAQALAFAVALIRKFDRQVIVLPPGTASRLVDVDMSSFEGKVRDGG